MRITGYAPVPAAGTVEYQYFVVDPGFDEDHWITAAQVIPGNRSVVHHAIVFVRPPDGSEFRGIGWLAGYVPGQRTFPYPNGLARRIPAGSKLVFQMHYTPNGRVADDLTQIGLVFADSAQVTSEVYTVFGIDQEFEIPPNTADHRVTGTVARLPAKGKLLSITPHMHLRGKSFVVSIGGKEGRQRLLDVPLYDFNWQHTYLLRKPVAMSDIGDLKFIATFDNSPSNPFNPDPNETVTWGDQTWEEMAVVFFDVAVPKDATYSDLYRRHESAEPLSDSELEEEVEKFIARFDTDRDGTVARSETPLGLRRFGFRDFDQDHDERITRDEIRRVVSQRRRQ